MSGSYLAVAIDHRSSFDHYLAAAGSRLARDEAKRRLAELVGGAVDGLVVESRRRPSWDVDWPQDIWWGAPDQLVLADTPPGQVAAAIALDDLDPDWVTGVKLGVNAAGAAWDRACDELEMIAELAVGRDLAIVFEPYFAESDEPTLRAEVLGRVTDFPQVSYSKLDLYSSGLLATYTGASRVPWLARSDGRPFVEYVTSLKEAVDAGCAGCMIGAALWSDLLGAVDEGASLLDVRLVELRSILAAQAPNDPLLSPLVDLELR